MKAKERAERYARKVTGWLPLDDERSKDAIRHYIAGATEQNDIDDVEITELRNERDIYYDRLLELREELAQKDEENGKALLYAVDKTTERVKREILDKACEWLKENADKYIYDAEVSRYKPPKLTISGKCWEDFRKAMEKEQWYLRRAESLRCRQKDIMSENISAEAKIRAAYSNPVSLDAIIKLDAIKKAFESAHKAETIVERICDIIWGDK